MKLISTTSEFHSPDVEVELDEARAAEDRRIINYGECIHDTEMLQSLFLEALRIEPFKPDIAIEILTFTKNLHSHFNLVESVSSFLEDKEETLWNRIKDNFLQIRNIIEDSQHPATEIKVRGKDFSSQVTKSAGAMTGAGAGAGSSRASLP